MQAIQTKWFGPTNVKGSRIKATAAAGSITVGYNHALSIENNHIAAAQALIEKLKWNEKGGYRPSVLHSGQLVDETYVHVLVEVA